MFVFPAFDSNYKTRKRTFNCCQNCRIKRVKCEITSTDYERVGCKTCNRHNWKCSLIKRKAGQPDDDDDDGKTPGPAGLTENDDPELDDIKESSDSSLEGFPNREPGPTEPLRITPLFLKQRFNFNILGPESLSTYQLYYHGHPKAIIANASEDQSIWHESGVYIKVKKEDDAKSYKVRNFGKAGKEKEFYIRNPLIYNFLLTINAFTLTSQEYPFDYFDTKQLVELYFYKINSIFPVVNESKFWDDFKADKAQNVLVYTMVLVIARDKMAESILRRVFSKNSASSDDPRNFTQKLQTFMTDLEYKIRQILLILPQLGDDDKFTRLVTLVLLSLHFNFDKLGNEQSSHDLTDAINLGVALGIHMKRLSSKIDPLRAEYTTNLWWCCYIFDRFNGLFNQRNLFIRQEDFNVDLPYNNINLLKLVQLARALENMFLAIYTPFNDTNATISGKENSQTPNNLMNINPRYNMFNIDEFQKLEFELCDQERNNPRKIYESNGNASDYVSNTIHFLSRIVNNAIIMGSQKAKYDNPQIPMSIPDDCAIRAASNIVKYVREMQEDYVINIPVVPWCISLAMAISLKRRTKAYFKEPLNSADNNKLEFELEDYLAALKKFSNTWWFVDEMYRLTKDFTDKLATKAIRRTTKRRKSASNNSIHKAQKLSPQSKPKWGDSRALSVPSNSMHSGYQSVSKADSIPSIQNILRPEPVAPETGEHYNRNSIENGSPLTTVSSNDLDYDQYFDSMQIDIFNYDFFKDVPNAINMLS
ncbi:uncharacterized protein CANTADRAFT_54730 [Suhomyces tanzawaensis NRRL Y-17324]|uniref:Zn(2)-C6 fungal-type domain-containing protein n=1 Tax=Suhomyces tanzawaensis NRRL Y-17324 TaxID=984487 RepID=A0A1E4SEP2_9ASCO|nr:uncharacterized protein CANTADRAFT_54730 [Suhomyces tanzawaensis NRRL Y-17324]ODV77999.1 hypothetical protein CANTADRAFT_54730 [Suhomyces tanzawaensis NRRL Y-17324]